MKDLDFEIGNKTYKSLEKALMAAASQSVSRGGEAVEVHVITWTRAAARAYGGEESVRIYNQDPEASIHDVLVVKVASKGPVY